MDLEKQLELSTKPGSGNLWSSKLTQAKSPRLRSHDRMQMKRYAKQKRSFLRGDVLGGTKNSSFLKDTQSKSRAALHQTVVHEETNLTDISVLFQPLNTSHASKRASSGLKSTGKMSTAGRLTANRSQFLVSQKMNLSAIDPQISPEPQLTFTNQQANTYLASQFGGTPIQQPSSKSTSRTNQQLPKKTQFIKKKKVNGAKRAKPGPDNENQILKQVQIGFEGTFQGNLPANTSGNQEISDISLHAPPPANREQHSIVT